ncbi:MAG: LapA family protein [Thermincola sp.]|jgi:uncharacterized integral membrane protein|nr:LapA family protein [Thermincola sp.]MDT3702661.1 LapA family protein [Thermincola sp.]
MPVYLVFGLIFSIAVAVFAVQNATMVDITLLLWQLKSISLVLVILGSALIGAMSAGLFGIVKQLRMKKRMKDYKTLLETREREIEYLKKKSGDSPATNCEPQVESGEKSMNRG